MYYCFLFIIVFDASYMLLPLYVLCSKIAIKNESCLFSSLESFCEVSRVQSGLWLKICWCVVCCLPHSTPHTIGVKRFNLEFVLCPRVGSLTFWRSYNIKKKNIWVYPALAGPAPFQQQTWMIIQTMWLVEDSLNIHNTTFKYMYLEDRKALKHESAVHWMRDLKQTWESN